MIRRRTEYIRYCDVEFCQECDAAWDTRQEAEAAALKDGWVRLTYNRWACPKCAAKILAKTPTPPPAAYCSPRP